MPDDDSNASDHIKRIALILFSSFLLYFSFPNIISRTGFLALSWVALVPAFFSAEGRRPAQRAAIGLSLGILSYSLLVNWIFPVSVSGASVFIVLMSLQTLMFFAVYPDPARVGNIGFLVVPAMWIITEYIRAIFMGGFAWNMGYSQAFDQRVVGTASLIGAYGVSFCVVAVNYALYRLIRRGEKKAGFIAAALFLSVHLYSSMFHPMNDSGRVVRLTLIQGNIDTREKWDDSLRSEIFETYARLTRVAGSKGSDLVVWPETALPGDYINDPETKNEMNALIRDIGVPFLFGNPYEDGDVPGKGSNAAFFVSPPHMETAVYKKIELIPFAEYIPKGPLFSIAGELYGGHEAVFDRGRDPGFFVLGQDTFFGVTICSEDFYPSLARKLIDRGARFIVNITNDDIFGSGQAPYFHAQALVMRAVETGRYFAQCANSGWTMAVSPSGEITRSLERNGDIFIEGSMTVDIPVTGGRAFYMKYGDMTAVLPAAFICLFWFIRSAYMRRNAAAALLMAALFIFCGRDAHAVGDPRRMQAQRTKAQQQTTVQMQAEVQARMKGPLEVEAEVFPVYMQQRHPLQDMNIDSYQIVDSFNPTTDEDYVVRFRKDSVQWINISEERKLKLVTFFIGEYRDKGITIGKPAEFYVNMIDQVAAQTPATLQQSLDRVVQVFAVIEYDFDNGQDKDLMARHVLGDKGFENNKRRLGLQ